MREQKPNIIVLSEPTEPVSRAIIGHVVFSLGINIRVLDSTRRGVAWVEVLTGFQPLADLFNRNYTNMLNRRSKENLR